MRTLAEQANGYVGRALRRVEDRALLHGGGRFVDDYAPPGTLSVAFVRGPYAHARIRSIDSGAAPRAPGVARILTAADTADLPPLPVNRPFPDIRVPPLPMLTGPGQRVAFVGQPVVAVIAETRAEAVDAAQLVEVEYEPLPVVSDPAAALAPAAPLVHPELGTNVSFTLRRSAGEVEAAFVRAAHVVRLDLAHPRLAPLPIEPRGLLASYDGVNDTLTVWDSTQNVFRLRAALAAALGLPEGRIRVVAADVGGSFGAKASIYREEVVVALAARLLGRPVRWIATRGEDFLGLSHGRGFQTAAELALDGAGRFLALRVRHLVDLGAELLANSAIPALRATMLSAGPYRLPAADVEAVGVFTNRPPTAPYRGAGRPEAAYVIERLMDAAARTLGLDPVELRRRNLIRPDEFPYHSPTGQVYDSGDYERALDRALELANYRALREQQTAERAGSRAEGTSVGASFMTPPAPPVRHAQGVMNEGVMNDAPTASPSVADCPSSVLGIGLATFVEPSAGGWESGAVWVEPGGQVFVQTGATEQGQGHQTTYAQIVADALGVEFEAVAVRCNDTAIVPVGSGTGGSRSLVIAGSALATAAEEVGAKARRVAARLLEAAPSDVVAGGGRFAIAGVPERAVSWAEVARTAYASPPPGEPPGLQATAFFQAPGETVGFGCCLAAVRVDPETGRARLERLVAVDDCGVVINPLLVDGQVLGGLARGLGQALLEEVRFDEQGQLVTGSLLDYAAPRAEHLPRIELGHTVTPSPLNPLGAKGVGESGTIGAPPAIANAVLDALAPFGVGTVDLPLTSEKLWRALRVGERRCGDDKPSER